MATVYSREKKPLGKILTKKVRLRYSLGTINQIYNFHCISGSFYSSSDSDSENERPDKKIHVEIKPLNNGSAPISASVDELRATVGNISLSPIGILSVRIDFLQIFSLLNIVTAPFLHIFITAIELMLL